MSGTAEQRSIMEAELYWFGGQLSAPKVYDTGTNFHAAPTVRGAVGLSAANLSDPESGRRITASVDAAGIWTVAIDPA